MSRRPSTATPLGRYLDSHDIKVKDLGYMTGINERVLSDFTSGRRRLEDWNSYFTRIADALDVEPSELLPATSSPALPPTPAA
jgi:transcriptional regulator with XRE-family HTH domain